MEKSRVELVKKLEGGWSLHEKVETSVSLLPCSMKTPPPYFIA